ncbi:MAG: GWxTD domain-containing protein [Candidatus Aminicenantales bacterium]
MNLDRWSWALRRASAPLIAVLCLALCGWAGEPQSTAGKKEPLSSWSKQWLEEVVPYIITDVEKKVFENLPNEEERGRFIAHFWEKRDPDPATPENEFKTVYYKRIALANKSFGASGISGWRTDRGKIFILLGPPQEIQRDFNPESTNPLTMNAARETWNYWNLANPRLPYNLEFSFLDKHGTGNFAMETSLVPRAEGSIPFDTSTLSYYFDRMEILAEATKNPFEGGEELRELITTQVAYDNIPFRYEALNFKGTAQTTYVPLFLEIPYSKLAGKRAEDKILYSLTLMISLSNPMGQSLFQKSKEVRLEYSESEARRLEGETCRIQTAVSWPPGNYKIHVLVLDNNTGKVGTSHEDFAVRSFANGEPLISDIFLSRESGTADFSAPISGSGNTPARVDRTFRPGDEMNIYFEVYNLSTDPGSGLNGMAAELSIVRDGRTVVRIPPPPSEPSARKDSRVQMSVKLKNFQPGSYSLKVNVTDAKAAKSAGGEVGFDIAE